MTTQLPPLQQPVIILDRPAHAGNVGAVARAMANTGFDQLRLVNPRQFPHPEAINFAAGGVKVLEKATLFPDLSSALADLNYIVATTNRNRGQRQQMVSPRDLGAQLSSAQERQETRIGILFGTERTGLESVDVARADILCNIPTAGSLGSLNLAQAVLIVTYELMMGMEKGAIHLENNPKRASPRASAQALEQLFTHMEETLIKIDFIKARQKKHMMGSLKALYHRADLDQREVAILRGILSETLAFGSKERKACEDQPDYSGRPGTKRTDSP
ncbi:MAG: RNA methyltransferase [Magnetococcales bacterium]|nr:RNA methyltransferase [Magnetococcales bacterium]